MPVKKKDTISERDATKILDGIDDALTKAYPAPKAPAFSEDKQTAIIEKAVLYHRIRGDEDLRTGKNSEANDKKFNDYADKIVNGKDPVVEHIKGKKPREQARLLKELTVSDTKSPWFEQMLLKADESIPEVEESKEDEPEEKKPEEKKPEEKKPEEKKPEEKKPEEKKPEEEKPEEKKAEDNKASAPDEKKKPAPETSAEKIKKEEAALKNAMYKKLADSGNMTAAQFLSNPENAEMAMNLLAVEHYNNMLNQELAEYELAHAYDSPEDKKKAMANRPLSECEKAAQKDYKAYMASLKQSPEVLTAFQRLATKTNISELGDATANAFANQKNHYHSNVAELEKKFIPGAIKEFLNSKNGPEKGSSLEKKLNALSAMKGKELPNPPSPEDCIGRMKEYKDILKVLEKEGKLDSIEGKQLKEALEGQIERLEDNSLQPDREKIGFDYKPDKYIDYYDPKDPTHTSMDAMEAREKLIRGEKLVQESFGVNDFVGKSQELTFDKKTGQIVRGPEKLITRPVDLSEETKKSPDKQLEDLKKIKDVLEKSDPFYVRNSESYKKTMESLNKVIKAQENMKNDANVRQSKTLKDLYADLDKNVADYLEKTGDKLKKGDDRGQIRKDAMETLQSITGKEHVSEITAKLYPEQAKLDKQQKLLKPCKKIMDKWKDATPSNQKEREEFKKDFEQIRDRVGKYGDQKYFKMGIAEDLEKFAQKAENIQVNALAPSEKIDPAAISSMKNLANEGKGALNELYAMDPDANPVKEEKNKEKNENKEKDKKVEEPKKEIMALQ